MKKIILICLLIFISNNSYGKTKLIKKYKTWNAYTSTIEKKKTCFIASEPIKFEGDYKKENRGKSRTAGKSCYADENAFWTKKFSEYLYKTFYLLVPKVGSITEVEGRQMIHME